MADIDDIKRIADTEFADIVINTTIIDYKLRIALKNHSFIDVYLSRSLPDKFGYHWECMDEDGTIYRYDNVPDKNWQLLSTYPYHFHNGTQNDVIASPFPTTILEGFRAFMELVKEKLTFRL